MLFRSPEAKRLLGRWWTESLRPLAPAGMAPLLDEVFRYDLLTQPVYRPEGVAGPDDGLPVVSIRGEDYYVRRDVELAYDVPAIVAALRADATPDLSASPRTLDLYYRTGSDSAVTSTNHEIVMHFMGMTADEAYNNVRGSDSGEPEDVAPEAKSGRIPLSVIDLKSEKGGCS